MDRITRMDGTERRRAPREEAYVAAELRTPEGERRLGVVQDASAVGVQLLTHTRLSVGDRVALAIQIDGKNRVDVEGVIRRVAAINVDGPWRFRIGVELDPESEELAGHAKAIRERQARLR